MRRHVFLALLLLVASPLPRASSEVEPPHPESSGGPYRLHWHTIDNGGGQSQRDTYRVTGTIAQPDAGIAQGGIYRVRSGFWPLAPVQSASLFSNGFE